MGRPHSTGGRGRDRESEAAGPDWRAALSGSDGQVRVSVRVQPGASRTRIAGLYGARIKVAIQAPPVDGKANAALVAFVAQLLGVPRTRVEVGAGHTSRDKRVDIDASLAEVIAAFAPQLASQGTEGTA